MHATTTAVKSYKDITIGQYNRDVIPVIKEGPTLDPVVFQARLIAALNGMTERDVLNLPISDYTDLALASKFLERPCEMGGGRLASKYTLGDVTLIPCRNYETMTAAQFIDFQQLSQDVEANSVAMLSVFLVPEGHAYNDGYDIRDVQRAIADHLSVQDAFEVLGFFFLNAVQSWRASLTSSRKMVNRLKVASQRRELKRKLKAATRLLKNGVG